MPNQSDKGATTVKASGDWLTDDPANDGVTAKSSEVIAAIIKRATAPRTSDSRVPERDEPRRVRYRLD
jgi:hypothetical protein